MDLASCGVFSFSCHGFTFSWTSASKVNFDGNVALTVDNDSTALRSTNVAAAIFSSISCVLSFWTMFADEYS